MGTTENLQAWSTTAATNANADTAINWAEGQDAASVNNSARSMMAAIAKHVDDLDGALWAGGSANALTVTTNQVLSAAQLTAGLRLLVKAISTNTSAVVTLAPDGLTPAPIKCADGSPLSIGSIQTGAFLDLVFNAGTSEWWAANIRTAGRFFATSSTTPAIATGVTTLVPYNSVAFNIGNYYDGSAGHYWWAPPSGGVLIAGCVLITGTTISAVTLTLYRGGNPYAQSVVSGGGQGVISASLNLVDAAVAGSAYQMYVLATGTGTLNIAPGPSSSFSGSLL